MLSHFFSRNPHGASKKKEYDFGMEGTKPIGSGGYSDVMKARWKARGGMLVAVKVVRKESIKDNDEYLKIIMGGLRRVSTCDRVCYALDWFETSTKYYLTFPLLTGGELLHRLNTRGRFTEYAAKRVLKVMLEILVYVHGHGIIHRDIKPDNFLYRTPESEIDDFLIIDFGISKILDKEVEDDPKDQFEIAGTPGYAAPEIFTRQGYGKNADIFGVGVIAYNLLSASSPWKSSEYVSLIKETIRSYPEFPPGPFRGVSDEAKEFILYLLNPDPYLRPSAKKALQHPWIQSLHAIETVSLEQKQHEPISRDDPERIPVPRPATLKPDCAIARQITAKGLNALVDDDRNMVHRKIAVT